jgi:DNA invertase Pin-like site-specific DNA recombinase
MAKGKFVAYHRVSTQRQGASGLGLDAQRKAVDDYLNGGDWELLEEFTEVESGKRADREQLRLAIAACRRHGAKLVIAKLDRLARSVAFVATLMESGVTFVAADMPEANNFTIHIMAAMAEHERTMISRRTKEALAQAKARGVKLGSPTIRENSKFGRAKLRDRADLHATNIVPIIREIQAAGITTLRGIADALTARGVATARGGMWHPQGVKNVIHRSGNSRR